MARSDFHEVPNLDSIVYLNVPADGGHVTIPDAVPLFTSDFLRDGNDLVLLQDGVPALKVMDYFAAGDPVDLMAENGAVLRGATVERLAAAATDGMYAQTGDTAGATPIGQVELVEGGASVQRTDGTIEQLAVGVKVFQQDVLITGDDGTLSVTFADGTIFSLSPGSRMIIDELIYNPDSNDNSGAFNLVQGGFVFIAGQVAKTGGMDVTTPSATMGIRGTTVQVDIQVVDGIATVEVALNRDPDGSVGSIELRDLDGNLISVITATDTKWVVSPLDGLSQEFDRTADDLEDDSVLISEAVAAFQSAVTRVQQGENFVNLNTSDNGQGNQDGPDLDPLDPDAGNDLGGEEQGGDGSDEEDGGEGDDTFVAPEDQTDIDNIRDPLREVEAEALDVFVTGLEDTGGEDPISGTTAPPDAPGEFVYAILTPPENGTASMNQDGSFNYVPDPDFFGTDSFTYTVTSPTGETDIGTVTVNVAPVNDDPISAPVAVAGVEDNQVSGQLSATDADGDTLSFTLASGASNGLVVLTSDGAFTYTPDENFNGTDSFAYTVSDGQGGTDTQTVTVTVGAENDAPEAGEDSTTIAEDTAITLDVLSNDTDLDDDTLSVASVTQGANGSVVINADGTVTYTPDANFNGTDTFTYTVTDGAGGTDSTAVTVTVSGENDAPDAQADTASTAEDAAVTVDVLANDTDLDGDALSVDAVTQGANGSVVINADGTVTYTPDENFNGTDSFTYTISDGAGGTDTQQVTVNVGAQNDAPEAANNSATTEEDAAITIDVLANDSDLDGDTLEVQSVTQGTNGSVVINADGTVTYTPDANFNGIDTFSYTVSDGAGGTDTATVTVNVGAENDAPEAAADSATSTEDNAITIDVLANDTDLDGDNLQVESVTQGTNGSVVINADATVTYTPDANFNGIDTFSYTVSDGAGGTDTVTVTVDVTAENDAPEAANNSASTDEDVAVVIDVLLNDTDLDGDALSVDAVTQGTNGAVVINADGTLTYTPDANFNGIDTFTYTVSDGAGGTDTATVTVNVGAENDAPEAVADGGSTAEDDAVTIDVLANDTDLDGDTLQVESVTQGANGSVVINADSTVTYTPDANFNGTDSFTYTVTDGAGGTDTETVTVTIGAQNDVPEAADDSVNTDEDVAVTVDVLGNDTDLDGDSLAVSSVTQGTNGTVVINADGTVTYTPDANFNGIDTFTYTVSDGAGGTDSATVTVNVGAENDAPEAVADSATTTEDNAVTIDVLTNDSDLDGDTLEVSSVTQGTNGSVVINSDGTVTYTPDANFNGTDTFSYTIADGEGGTDTASVTVTVTAENDPPEAVTNSATTDEDVAVTIDVLANDTDLDGDDLDVASVTQGTNGAVVINADGTVTYTPDANFNGTDSFSYTVSDGAGGTDTATVTVTVAPENDAPEASPDSGSTAEDDAVIIDVLANDTDLDGDTLQVESVTQGANGSVVINADGTVTYTPDANFNGTDSFTYTVTDGAGGIDTETVTVTIGAQNDVPEAADDAISTGQNTVVTGNLFADNGSGPDSDIEGDSFVINTVNGSAPVFGTPILLESGATLTLSENGDFIYNPNGAFGALPEGVSVTESITYTVLDENGGESNEATADFTVLGSNDAPLAQEFSATIEEGEVLNGQLGGTDIDTGDVLTYGLGGITPDNGSVVVNTDGSFAYTPAEGFFGVDSFEVVVTDAGGLTDTATVNVIVQQDTSDFPDDFPVELSFNVDADGEAPAGSVNVDVTPVSSTGVNLVFALDSSGSVTAGGWSDLIDSVEGALQILSDEFDGSATPVDVQIISYATNVVTTATFDLVDDIDALIAALNDLEFQAGQTNWEGALGATEAFFDTQPTDETNILYFITDGDPFPTNQDWEGALDSLTDVAANGYDVDIQAFGIGEGFTEADLIVIDSDNTVVEVAQPSDLTDAFEASPLFNAMLVDFSLQLTVDGVDQGEIADENSAALTSEGLSFALSLADIDGLGDLLGASNGFSTLATFDLDGDATTTGDQITLFSGADISKETDAQTKTGSAQNDLLMGSDLADVISGGDGSDIILGFGGDDTLTGGAGADLISAGAGDDRLVVDTLSGLSAANPEELDGGAGRDVLDVDVGGDLNSDVLPVLSLTDIEAIDMENGLANQLTLSLSDVIDLSSDADSDLEALLGRALEESATILGDGADSVTLVASSGGSIRQNGDTGTGIDVYEFVNGSGDVLATVGIDSDVTVNLPSA